MKLTNRTGLIVGAGMARPEDHVMLLSANGILIRIAASQISLIGRDTQGVTLMKLGANDSVASMTIVTPKDASDDFDPASLNGHGEGTNVAVVPPGE
jgi:DNA gyrase subunit A